jgi:hypothetical protein
MTRSWFQKDIQPIGRLAPLGRPALGARRIADETAGLAARLKPQELIAMLMHHYKQVRARSQPKVKVSIAVSNPKGNQAVTISFG